MSPAPPLAERVARAYGAYLVVWAFPLAGALLGSLLGVGAEGWGQLGYAMIGAGVGAVVGVLALVPVGRRFGLGVRFGVVMILLITGLVALTSAARPAIGFVSAVEISALLPVVAAAVTGPVPARLRPWLVTGGVGVAAVAVVVADVVSGVHDRAAARRALTQDLLSTALRPAVMRDDLGWHVAEVNPEGGAPHAIVYTLARGRDEVFVGTELTVPGDEQPSPFVRTLRLEDETVSLEIRTGDVTDEDLDQIAAQLELGSVERLVELAS
jgi:hypothetical protein